VVNNEQIEVEIGGKTYQKVEHIEKD